MFASSPTAARLRSPVVPHYTATVLSRSRRALVIAAVAALAIVAVASRAFLAKDAAETRYRTEPVSRGPLVTDVTATGTVNPVKTVQVGTYVSGPIQAIYADFNSEVKKGQTVARIDPRPFELRVQQAEATLANAHAKVAKSAADLKYKTSNLARNKQLATEGIISRDLIDTTASSAEQARADVALNQAEVKQAEAALAEARVNLGYTDIISPVDGVVVSRNVDVGQTVAASFQTPTLFLIAEDLTQMQVDTNVSESDIGAVAPGQRVTFTVDAYPDRRFEGTVVQVRNAPQNVQNVITYDVVVGAKNEDLALRPGMTANVAVETGRRDEALRVPSAALRFRPHAAGTTPHPSGSPGTRRVRAPDSGGSKVFVLRDEAPIAVPVQIGLADDSYTEITKGDLKEGDPVVVGVERPNASGTPSRAQPPGFMGGGGGGRRR